MIEKLQALVDNTKKVVIGQVIKSKVNTSLYEWLCSETNHMRKTETISTRIQYVLAGKPDLSCKNGNTKQFNIKTNQPKFCGQSNTCACFREHIVIFNQENPQSKEQLRLATEKRKQTWLDKYGVENISHHTPTKQKRKETMAGRDYNAQNIELYDRQEAAGMLRVIDRVKDYVTPMFTREDYSGSFRKNRYDWKCNTCDTIFDDHIDYGRIPRCPLCNVNNISVGEKELREYLASLNVTYETNNRTILSGNELDIYMPDRNLAIEFNGVYWHSSQFKDQQYHVGKTLACETQGIHLIHIFEDEWVNKKEIVKNRIKSVLGIGQRLYARKCRVDHITSTEYKEFVTLHHLQGYAPASHLYGLKHNDILVAVMSFGRGRYHKSEYELIRYCSVGNIVGGASKLFSAFTTEFNPTEVISYANRTWSQGGLYNALGFKDITIDKKNTGFFYIKDLKRYHRSSFTKKRLVKLGYDAAKTAEQIMGELGYLKIFDAGNLKFQWISMRNSG